MRPSKCASLNRDKPQALSAGGHLRFSASGILALAKSAQPDRLACATLFIMARMNKVELEFKRIQTYLFASPRLRAMLGANASLGQTIRTELLHRAKACCAVPEPSVIHQLPEKDDRDPLKPADNLKRTEVLDNPREVYREYGVLVRDGGHFIATFEQYEKAQDFVKEAIALITEKLPGILVQARINGQALQGQGKQTIYPGEALFQHPSFQVSQHVGNQPAASKKTDNRFVSTNEAVIEESGRVFRTKPTDLIGWMEQQGVIPRKHDEPPKELGDLSESGYIALIHADGNSIGKRYQQWRDRCTGGDLAKEAHGEHFFYSMRVAVRAALQEALQEVFAQTPESYQLLMLGGDDLLMVCDASQALPFVRAYAKTLEKFELADKKPLTIGAGVVIAKKTFPFHRMHAMAEELASSAKQLSRADDNVGSVVDWHITSNAWVNDPIAQRRLDSLSDSAALSCKPYPVIGAQSLATLLDCAEKSGGYGKLARSQLRHFVDIMRQGHNLAELAFAELPDQLRRDLADLLKAFDYPDSATPFKKIDNQLHASLLPDLVEIMEIRQKQNLADQGASA